MILRIDRWGTELPPPSEPDPDGASAVQELMYLEVVDGPPEGAAPNDLPPQPKAFAPDAHPEEIAEIAQMLRMKGGLPKEPTGEINVPASPEGVVGKVKDALT